MNSGAGKGLLRPLAGLFARERDGLGSSTTAISPTWTPELRYLSEEKESVDPLKDSLLKRQKGVLQYVKQAQLQADRMGYRACVFVTLTASSGAAEWDAKGAISAYTDKLSKWLLRRGGTTVQERMPHPLPPAGLGASSLSQVALAQARPGHVGSRLIVGRVGEKAGRLHGEIHGQAGSRRHD